MFDLLGMGFSMMGAAEEGAHAKAAALENQRMAGIAAADTTMRGMSEAGRARMDVSQLVAQQKLAYANSGVDPTVGTAAAVMADTMALGELDARTIENNAAREAWGIKRQADTYGKQAKLEDRRTFYKMTGTILGTSGEVMGRTAQARYYDAPSDEQVQTAKQAMAKKKAWGG